MDNIPVYPSIYGGPFPVPTSNNPENDKSNLKSTTTSTPDTPSLSHLSLSPPARKNLPSDVEGEDDKIGKMSQVSPDWLGDLPTVSLHGTLSVSVRQARNLPNLDMVSSQVGSCFTFCSSPCRPAGIKIRTITSDPYASVYLGEACMARTRVIHNNEFPEWNDHFTIYVAHSVKTIDFVVKDSDVVGSQLLGKAFVPAQGLINGQKISGWFDVVDDSGKNVGRGAQIEVEIKYVPVEMEYLQENFEVSQELDTWELNSAYFPLRKGGKVALYQDSHIAEDFKPEILLDGNTLYEPQRCWEDIARTIINAKHVIYIAGWSVFTDIKLMRDPSRPMLPGADLSLGELLKKRAREGVRVLVMVWDDVTSINSQFVNNAGLMGTHDEDTRKFFRHTKVRCLLAPRLPDGKLTWLRKKLVGTIYTHHQKCLIADGEPKNGNGLRPLVAYLGGIDLCGGRYDTQHHPLFRNLQSSMYKEDFYQNNLKASLESGGPRQPWHDLHLRLDGSAAWDVLLNFEQRWRQVTRFKKERLRVHDLRLLHRTPEIAQPTQWAVKEQKVPLPATDDAPLMVTHSEDKDTWHVQLLRSIDSGSVKGFPKHPEERIRQHLASDKGTVVEKSIQSAYVKAIRRAQHFIYIENQYFLGSSFGWSEYKDAGANQMIPIELALKIASKILKNEPFRVYVVIPMWPEGVPTSASVQAILHWQKLTMEMMYKIIAEAISEKKLSGVHPRDFLTFFCLGGREKPETEETPSEPKTVEEKVLASRRQMIYVHSKMMVVDDEYVILGSANINQRSMDGSRDTELALGAFQPHHSWRENQRHPHGQVFGFRMSLWTEHLGLLEEVHGHPQTIDCIRRVNAQGDELWKQYSAEEITDLEGHLLSYPILVQADGTVDSLPDFDEFPDVGGKIIGSIQRLPQSLTT